jgi:hypothetical protein
MLMCCVLLEGGRTDGRTGLYDLAALFLFLGWCFGECRDNSLKSTLSSQPYLHIQIQSVHSIGGVGGGDAYLIKNILQPLLRKRRTLNILNRPQLPRQPFPLLKRNRPLSTLCQLIHHIGIISQINHRAHDDTRRGRTMMSHLGEPLFLDVFKTRRGGDVETD